MQAQIFIDADNISPAIGFDVIKKFSDDYSVARVDIIGNFENMSLRYRKAAAPCYVQNCFHGKNSADTWLCVEIAKTIYEKPEIEVIIIVSNDRDFLPAVRLAVDKKKLVLLVSDGNGHRNFMRILQDLQTDLNFVKLIDYDGLPLMERSQTAATPRTQKIDSFYKKLSGDSAGFLRRYEDRIKFIFVTRGKNFVEVPFVPGMTGDRFKKILYELKIIGKKVTGIQAAHGNLLKVLNDRIYFYQEEELENSNIGRLAKFPQLSNDVRKFFLQSKKDMVTVFIKYGGQIRESPFLNGMRIDMFSRILHELKIIGKNTDVRKVIAMSLLKAEGDFVYFLGENEPPQPFEDKKIVEKFFSEHKNEVRKIFIKHDGQLYEVPFVNGMTTSMLAKSLRGSKIIGKKASIQKVIAASLLKIKNNRVYLLGEEELTK